jgi:ribosomal protein S18 acetylase RimI-like enzyme
MAMGFTSIAAFLRNTEGEIMGGVTGKAYWGWLHIEFLWVEFSLRKNGYGGSLLCGAESEARNQGCKYATLDTFSFQAKGFYEKLGYEVFGTLQGYTGEQERYYLRKGL